MKKIVLFSLLLIASAAMTSCTADENVEPVQNQVADDTGGQHGHIPPPPPPPSYP
ncbi:hypothetical protein [Flavobacterium sp.]|uniref:hypothetical protein n=1 Tax=Flavobacterium sp. TaxID=239 RepID=UPI002B4ABCF1|nr:hypothetical protein [Flavobacterium sp.]HLP65500.1 hypothetical protein [Flavobacterium sp.]